MESLDTLYMSKHLKPFVTPFIMHRAIPPYHEYAEESRKAVTNV